VADVVVFSDAIGEAKTYSMEHFERMLSSDRTKESE